MWQHVWTDTRLSHTDASQLLAAVDTAEQVFGERLFQSHEVTLGSQERTVVQPLACSTIDHTHQQSRSYFSFLIQEMQIIYVSDLAAEQILSI